MFRKLAGLTAVAGLFIAGTASADIAGTSHDFTAELWNPGGELCIVCHTTHNTAAVAGAVLWNHEVTSTVFTLYASGTMDASVTQPAGVSLLCLSCHDGTVALENFGGVNSGTNFVTGAAQLTDDLSNDHPIGITFDTTLSTTDGELFDPSTQASGLGGTVAQDLLFGIGNDQLECSSCHDVHDSTNPPFLVKDNSGSNLCFTCHNK